MKREICCLECAESWSKRVPGATRKVASPVIIPAEYQKQVAGLAKGTCICDGCAKTILKNTAAVAVSIYTDDHPYFEWESEYLEGGREWEMKGPLPKPWRIWVDWTVEVIAANGAIVGKFQTREEAEAFIAAAGD